MFTRKETFVMLSHLSLSRKAQRLWIFHGIGPSRNFAKKKAVYFLRFFRNCLWISTIGGWGNGADCPLTFPFSPHTAYFSLPETDTWEGNGFLNAFSERFPEWGKRPKIYSSCLVRDWLTLTALFATPLSITPMQADRRRSRTQWLM